MAKKKSLIALFRGVPFHIDADTRTFGRRGADHEYPKREDPHSQELGRKSFDDTVEAYVIGDDYMKQLDALISACNKPGPGDLVHPVYGTLRVVCRPSSARWSSKEDKIAYVSLSFKEAGKPPKSGGSSDPISSVLSAAEGMVTAANTEFEKTFDVVGKASHVVDDAVDKVEKLSTLMDLASKGMRGKTAEIASLAYKLRNLKADALDLIRTPGVLAERLEGALSLFSAIIPGADRKEVIGPLSKIIGFGRVFAAVPQATESGRIIAGNQKALVNLVRRQAVANAAVELVQQPFSSREDAVVARRTFTDVIAEQLEHTETVEAFAALKTLRSELVAAVPEASGDLPSLISVTPAETVPSLVLAYSLYGSLDNEEDLVKRNKLSHPGFVPGGKALTVIGAG